MITRRRLKEFGDGHTDAVRPLDAWFRMMRAARLRAPEELKTIFPAASFLGDTLTVFNIAGNKYRLVVNMRYDLGRVYIRQVLTHEDYDRLTRRGAL